MDRCNIARKLAKTTKCNSEGIEVSAELGNGQFGLPVTNKMIHPEYLVVFNEAGNNTNQTDDGNLGSQKLVVEKGNRPRQTFSTKNIHCTTHGVTAGTGEPVLCVIVLDRESMNSESLVRVDIQNKWIVYDSKIP